MIIPAELVAVLIAGLVIFVGLARWAVSFFQVFETKRMRLLDSYEKTLLENAKLKAEITIRDRDIKHAEQHAKHYYKEMYRYRNLYQETLDRRKDTGVK